MMLGAYLAPPKKENPARLEAAPYRPVLRSQSDLRGAQIAMGQNPVPPVNIPIPTEIE